MENAELIQRLNKQVQTELPQHISQDELQQMLSEFINHLIQTDFQRLVFILYKTDVSEKKVKLLLQQNSNEYSAPIIAKLIIERERQKMISKSTFRGKENIPDEEKW